MSRKADPKSEAALREELAAGIIRPSTSTGAARSSTHAAQPHGLPGPARAPLTKGFKVPGTAPPGPAPSKGGKSGKSGKRKQGVPSLPGPVTASVPLGAGGAGGRVAALPLPARVMQRPPSQTPGFKGTPSRSVRYSLPVRKVDKPVRSTKVTGKHVLLPSESQLAPLPPSGDEEEESSSSEEDGEEADDPAAPSPTPPVAIDKAGPARAPRVPQAVPRRPNVPSALPKSGPTKPALPSSAASRPSLGSPSGSTRGSRKTSRYTRAPPKVPRATGPAYHTFERMPAHLRIKTSLPRLTSYAIGTSIHIPTLVGYLRREHAVKPRLYEESVYAQYHKPLLPGFGRANIRSAPEPRSATSPNGSHFEREILEREESGYVGGYFAPEDSDEEDIDQQGYIRDGNPHPRSGSTTSDAEGATRSGEFDYVSTETEESDADKVRLSSASDERRLSSSLDSDDGATITGVSPPAANAPIMTSSDQSDKDWRPPGSSEPESSSGGRPMDVPKKRRMSTPRVNLASHNPDTSMNFGTTRATLEALQLAELVIMPYGVLVLFNFTAHEEKELLEDVLASGAVRGTFTPSQYESEAFHFCYDPSLPAPRIFNDFFTFRGQNHLLKLSLAHAIAQSTLLSTFEENMQTTLEKSAHIPRQLASSGSLHLKRIDAVRLTGRLFKLRVDVNLTSNVLDTPEIFWSEASLQALYTAIRDYLEIDQRVDNLNERLKVVNDLLDIIHEHIGNESMSHITWIIIILCFTACIVELGELGARLAVAARRGGGVYALWAQMPSVGLASAQIVSNKLTWM